MLQCNPDGVAEKRAQDVGFHAVFELMKERPDREPTFESTKRRLRIAGISSGVWPILRIAVPGNLGLAIRPGQK